MRLEQRSIGRQKLFQSSYFSISGMKRHSGSIDPQRGSRLGLPQKLRTGAAVSTVQSVTRIVCQERNRIFLSDTPRVIGKRYAMQRRLEWPIHCGCTPSFGRKVNTTPMRGPELRREA